MTVPSLLADLPLFAAFDPDALAAMEASVEPESVRGGGVVRPRVQDLPVLDSDRFDTLVERGHAAAVEAVGPWLAERGDEPW